MNKIMIIAASASLMLISTGCGSNRIVGNNLTQEGHWYGEVGVTGHQNDITIQAPSELTKLSIIGNANKIYVDDHVPVGKIEIWGRNNSISIPERLIIRSNQIGKQTVITRRPGKGRWTTRKYVYDQDKRDSTGEEYESVPLEPRGATTTTNSSTEPRDASHYYSPAVTIEEE